MYFPETPPLSTHTPRLYTHPEESKQICFFSSQVAGVAVGYRDLFEWSVQMTEGGCVCPMSGAQAPLTGDQTGRRTLPTAGSDLHQCSIIVASDPGLGLPLLPW